jgi:hypothetical protein
MNLNLWEDGEILFDTEQMEGYCEVGSYVLRHDERACQILCCYVSFTSNFADLSGALDRFIYGRNKSEASVS